MGTITQILGERPSATEILDSIGPDEAASESVPNQFRQNFHDL